MSIAPAPRTSRAPSFLAVVGVVAVGALLGAPRAAAQEPEDSVNERSERIAATYRLTEPVLKKYAAAMRELLALARKDPAVVQTGDNDAPPPPAIRAIFTRAGLSEDELEKFSIAMAWAQMGSMGASMSGEAARELEKAPPVVRANIAFLKTHETALKALGADMKALRLIQEGRTEAEAAGERASELKVTGALRAGANSEIELEVTGGQHAGRYAAKVSEGGCSYGMAKKGAWGNQYSINTDDRKKFSSLQLIMPDAEGAAPSSESFLLMVTFGPLVSLSGPAGTNYKVETTDSRDAEGQGTVRVQDSGAGATISFDAKTKDGVGLKGTIRCHTVMRMS